jgi:PleD family two-component response regulator
MTPLPADLVLLAAPTREESDRIAHAMTPLASYAFVFAQSIDAAVQVATSVQPDLVIAAFHGRDGITTCKRLRLLDDTRAGRVLLLLERSQLNGAWAAGASSVVLRPASSILIALEAKHTLERVERRILWVPDRRSVFRGGRRLADVGEG